jgi:hypothetical protein
MPSGIPVEVRLRRGLKLLRRSCELACTDIRELKSDNTAAGSGHQPDGRSHESGDILGKGDF